MAYGIEDDYNATIKELEEKLRCANLQVSDMKGLVQDLRGLLAEKREAGDIEMDRPFIIGCHERLAAYDARYPQ